MMVVMKYVSTNTAEASVIRDIGNFKEIKTVILLLAPRKGDNAEAFSFRCSWTVFRTLLHLSSGQLDLVNVTYLVIYDSLNCEVILIGLSVLLHLQADSCTLLKT